MKKFLTFIAFFIVINSSFSQIKPNQIANLTLWLRADSNIVLSGSYDSIWKDCSGNNNHASQPVFDSMPSWINNTLNGKPVLSFNGSQFLKGTTLANINNSSLSVFIVANGSNYIGSYSSPLFGVNCYPNHFYFSRYKGDQSFYVLNLGTYANGLESAGSLPNAGFPYKILEYTKNFSSVSKIYINSSFLDSTVVSQQTGAFTNGNYYIAKGDSINCYTNFFHGNIAEIIIYSRSLTDNERMSIEQYLSSKYAKQIDLGQDIQIHYGFGDTTLNAGGGFSNYLWSTGETTQSITVNKGGTYFVQADDFFNHLSKDTIVVTYPPTVLNHGDTTICLGSSISLSSTINPFPTKYTYHWSTGSNSQSINVSTPGSYWVKITDSLGLSFRYSDTIHITVDSIKNKIKLGGDTTFCAGNYIHLISAVPNPQSLTYLWSNSSSDSILTINTSGQYWVKVTDLHGCFGRDTIMVSINGSAPAALFRADTVCLGDTTHFTDLSTPADSVSKWHWQFTSTDTSNLKNPSFLFGTYGNHNVTLTAYTHGGCYNAYGQNVWINPLPSVDFNADTGCYNTAYAFFGQSIAPPGDSITGWSWNFGDPASGANNYSVIRNPSHLFVSAGVYSISLTVSTLKGCSRTAVKNLQILLSLPSPAPPLLYSPANGNYITDTNINFSWQTSQNAFLYKFVLASDMNFSHIIHEHFTDSTQAHFMFNNHNQTIFWKVLAYNTCNDSSTSPVYHFSIFYPGNISGLNLWLKADSGISKDLNDQVTQWNDWSGNNNNAQSSSGPKWIDNILNGHPVLNFDGIDDSLYGTTIPGINQGSLSIFIVANGLSYSGTHGYASPLFGVDCYPFEFYFSRYEPNHCLNVLNTGSYLQGLRSAPNSLPDAGFPYKIMEYTKNLGVISKIFANGIFLNDTNAAAQVGTFNNGNYFIAKGISLPCFTEFFHGDIAEIILFNNALPDTDRISIENYLDYKYAGPPVDLGPDINIPYGFCDTTLDAGPRYTHYQWSTGDTTQSISVNRGGAYWVSVTDLFGFPSSDTVMVNRPTPALHDTVICLYGQAHLQTNLGPGYHYSWSNSDTLPDIYTNFPGTYSVTITDTIGCTIIDSVVVAIDSFAIQASLGPDRTACQGELLVLAQGAQQASVYHWSDGTGNAYLVINAPLQTYAQYSVTVSSVNGCVAIDTITVFIRGIVPALAFTFDSVCAGLPTQFTDHSTAALQDSISNWLWTFGGGGSSSVQNPIHTFNQYGIYNTTLKVTTDSGCFKSLTLPVIVWANPRANFSPVNGCSGVPILFHDISTNQLGTNTGWHWDFGVPGLSDTSDLQNPGFTYDTAGDHTVQLIVSSAYGCKDTLRQNVHIRPSLDPDFFFSHCCLGEEMYFNDLTAAPPWNPVMEWNWLFGDGDSSQNATPVHLYDSAGNYTVKMIIHSMNGCTISKTNTVAVYPLPHAAIGSTNLCLGDSAQMIDSSTIVNDTIAHWYWNFQGLGSSSLQNPIITPTDTGILNVTLMVLSNHGCGDTIIQPVHVYPLPHASFSFSPAFGPSPLFVDFTNSSTNDVTWHWSFGDGNTSPVENPQNTYTSNNIYTVLLTVYSPFGCSDTVSHPVYVIPMITDVAVAKAYATLSGSYLTYEADIMNLGQRTVNDLDIYARFNGTGYTLEHWHGSLLSGESMHYVFNARVEVFPEQSLDFVCVRATIPGYDPDDVSSNNEKCDVLNDHFIVSDLYPNPSTGGINMDVIIPFGDDLTVELFSDHGKKIAQLFSGSVPKGYNTFFFDLSIYQSGVYGVRVNFHGNIEVRKFVKL